MGDVVDIKPIPTRDDIAFVQDMARFSEGLTDESAIRKKYRLTESDWEKLGSDDDLVRAITDEKTRRIRDKSHMREKSQLLVTRAPDVLSGILLDDSQSARHRIDSAKVLNDFCNGPGDTAPASDRFLIQINLGADTLTYNKRIRPLEPGEVDPDDVDTTPFIAAIAAKKTTENDGGCESI